MTNNQDEFLERANDILINVYPFWPVQFERGEGCYLYDTEGTQYLDMGAGIAVSALGYGHKEYVKALQDQIAQLHMSLCYVPDAKRMEAAEEMLSISDFDQIFFCSTGAEAVEGALKTVRKWAKENKAKDALDVIYVKDSFHGRTMGALSVNGQDIYREGFDPLLSGTHEAIFNDLDSVKALITDKVSAIIVEPVLGEGGIIPATQEFLQGLRSLCDEHEIALIFDEVQCGMGRLGTVFAYQYFGIVPDILCMAKGLGAGFPVGAFMGKRKFTQSITHGSHGSTYGGNPLACTAVSTVLKEIQKEGFLDNVKEVGKILHEGLEELARKTNKITNVRGAGMMLAADYEGGPVKELILECLKEGLIILSCGDNALRFVPPLILTPEQAQEALTKLENVISNA